MDGGPIGIAGAGRLGAALARLLREAGEPVAAVASRNPGHAAAGARFAGDGVRAARLDELPRLAGRILITVADDAIAEVAETLAGAGMTDGAALHTCGAWGPEPLAPLAAAGVSCGALHPIQTVPRAVHGLASLRGISWGVTAEGPAGEWARRIVSLAGGEALEISPASRPLYHAAAVLACNYLVGLQDAALSLLAEAGLGREEALRALAPIVDATRRNIFALGPAEALTGPVLRGDAGTIARHLKAVSGSPEPVRGLYRAAARQTLQVARRRGLDEAAARRLEELLSLPDGAPQ